MSLSDALQEAIYAHLVADPEVHALIGDRIFDRMPSDGDYPCATFGPSDTIDDDVDCIGAEIETLQIDVWILSNGRLNPCKRLAETVKRSLHKAQLNLATGALVEMRVTSRRVFVDGSNPQIAHGVLTVEAMLEDVAV